MSQPTTSIPAFYRVVFKYVDPMFCCLGIYMHFFDKTNVIKGLAPNAIVPPGIETSLMADYMLGFFAMLGCMQVSVAFGRPNDLFIWQALQASTAVLDVVQIWSTLYHLNLQGRMMNLTNWLPGENQNVLGNAGILAIRTAFCLGIGLSSKRKAA